jgi:hypothetical protein
MLVNSIVYLTDIFCINCEQTWSALLNDISTPVSESGMPLAFSHTNFSLWGTWKAFVSHTGNIEISRF